MNYLQVIRGSRFISILFFKERSSWLISRWLVGLDDMQVNSLAIEVYMKHQHNPIFEEQFYFFSKTSEAVSRIEH